MVISTDFRLVLMYLDVCVIKVTLRKHGHLYRLPACPNYLDVCVIKTVSGPSLPGDDEALVTTLLAHAMCKLEALAGTRQQYTVPHNSRRVPQSTPINNSGVAIICYIRTMLIVPTCFKKSHSRRQNSCFYLSLAESAVMTYSRSQRDVSGWEGREINLPEEVWTECESTSEELGSILSPAEIYLQKQGCFVYYVRCEDTGGPRDLAEITTAGLLETEAYLGIGPRFAPSIVCPYHARPYLPLSGKSQVILAGYIY
ncbi:hypothetical protein RRG08_039845 [Elysia crispata]|uniref:Uncharacterized protein n=1 Tax=Elysia crispata TaxID=231223 RepID=A0AAE0ZVD2_9GAST|nr:hypothetical protein RRG08_039845 [Elysia crispata]